MDNKIIFSIFALSLCCGSLCAQTSDQPILAWGLGAKTVPSKQQAAPEKRTDKQRIAELEKEMAELKKQENPSWKRLSGLYVGGEALYWKAMATGVPVAGKTVVLTSGSFDPQTIIQKLIYPHFSYDWGWRGLLGYDLPFRQWSLDGTWTHFSTTGKKNINSTSVITIWGSIGSDLFPEFVESKDAIKLNFYDAEFGKKIGFASPFSIKPHMGFRWAYIDEKLSVFYGRDRVTINTGTARFKMKNDFQGIGLKAGLDADWEMKKGWAFFGKSGVSFLWGTTDLTRRETYHLNNDNVIANFDHKFPFKQKNMQTALELLLGLRIDIKIGRGKANLHLQGGYEVVYLPDFKQMGKLLTTNSNQVGIFTQYSGSLAFHGYNMGARLDF